MADEILKSCEANDPRRCQAVVATTGQCTHLSVEGQSYCPIHRRPDWDKGRNYALTKFRAEIQRKADSSEVKSLREEIGILRLMLETRINKVADEMDLILHSGPISDLVLKIEKLVASCHKLEGSMGQLLDKSAILQFAGNVINIISEHVEDTEAIEAIANGILKLTTEMDKS